MRDDGRALAWLAVAICIAASGCESDAGPMFADIPRVAEALRASEPSLSSACDDGFPEFLQLSRQVLTDVPGSARYQKAIAAYRESERLDPASLPEPALLRLLLHRYGAYCHGSRVAELSEELGPLAELGPDEVAERLREIVASGPLGQHAQVVDRSVDGARAVMVELPTADAEDTAPTLFFVCLSCRAASPVDGPTQIAVAVAALEAIAASRVVPAGPVHLVVCLDASRKPQNCLAALTEAERQSTSAFALDGIEPLVVAWSGEVAWHLSVPHKSASRPWLAASRRRPRRNGRDELYILDVRAEGTLDDLPTQAWMDLFDPARTPPELQTHVASQVRKLAPQRPEARYEVEVVEDRVRVSARAKAAPAWEIAESSNALWDLAVMARALRVQDPPQGGLADMIRVINRFDGDPHGARLGLHYHDPVGGGLLVAPCTLIARDGRAVLGIRMYRPPGLEREAFIARLLEARERLRRAARGPLVEAERDVADPSRVDADSETVRVVQRAYAATTGLEPPTPTGVRRPGLGTLLPDALSVRLPAAEGNRVSPSPAVALVIELVWQIAIAEQ